jgi:hypothetical protein
MERLTKGDFSTPAPRREVRAREIEITPAMIDAGKREVMACWSALAAAPTSELSRLLCSASGPSSLQWVGEAIEVLLNGRRYDRV